MILATLATQVDFIEKSFGYITPAHVVTGENMLNEVYKNDFAGVFKVTPVNIEQIIDGPVLRYLNQNTDNFFNIKSSADTPLYPASSFTKIIN